MNAFVKLAVGATLLGIGFVISMHAQRELVGKFAKPCEDCDDENVTQLHMDLETNEENEVSE